MGLPFITEGAIPFAAADPVRVLPACIIGAGTAGALSMFFECTLRAPWRYLRSTNNRQPTPIPCIHRNRFRCGLHPSCIY